MSYGRNMSALLRSPSLRRHSYPTPPALRHQSTRNVGGTAICSANHVNIRVTTGAADCFPHSTDPRTACEQHYPVPVATPHACRETAARKDCFEKSRLRRLLDRSCRLHRFIDLMRASCADLHAQRKAYLSDCRTLAPSIAQQLNEPRARSAYLGVGLSYARVNPIVIAQGSNGARGRLLFR